MIFQSVDIWGPQSIQTREKGAEVHDFWSRIHHNHLWRSLPGYSLLARVPRFFQISIGSWLHPSFPNIAVMLVSKVFDHLSSY